MAMNARLRGVIIAGASLAVIAGAGIGFAVASPAQQTRYVTASAGTGDVTQTYTATGTITRTNTSEAAFAVDGTVSSVKVAVGDTVDAGDVLAVLKKGPLQLAVLDAETAVAEARASLYSAQHPSSTSSRSGGSSDSSGSSGSASSGSGGTGSSGSGSSGGSSNTVTIDPAPLLAATNALTKAVSDEQTACEPVFGAVPDPEPTTSPTPSATASASPTTSASPSETAGPSASPSESATPSETASATTSATPEPTAEPTVKDQADTIESNDPTDAELKACGEARAQVNVATQNLQTLVLQLTQGSGGSKPSGSTGSSSKGTSSAATSSSAAASSASSSATVSEAQVASAEAKLLAAEQELQAAQDDLDNAELLAPISGTVGTVELAAGNAASAGSITIVGEGNAQVSFELPLKTRTAIKAGQQVTVTPAGSTKNLTGKVTSISAVETSGTAGDTPTYTTVVTVADPDGLLASGAKASVTIPVDAATNVVRVPASAVTPTGTGTATVSVLQSGSETPTTVQVETGAVGGGWVEITSGLTAGQTVVLADNTAELPSNTNNNRRTTTTTRASTSPSAAAQPGGSSTGGAQPSAAPSATPSR